MGNIRLSIIIPLYNKEKHIKKTIDSVLNQDFSCFELIVVDDGSTDKSAEIVSQIQDNRIRLIQQSNSGVSKARNMGAQIASSSWLIFLEGDDVFMSGTLRNYANMIFRYPHNGVFIANYKSSEHLKLGSFRGKKERVYENPLKAMWHRDFYPHPGNIMCSKNAFMKIGGFDERMSYYEDFEFGARLIKNFSIVYSPFVCMEYVVESNEARIKLHPLEKEYAFYIESESLENPWLKNYCYTIFKGFIQKRRKGNDIDGLKALIDVRNRKFGRYYYLNDFLYRIRRKLLRHGI